MTVSDADDTTPGPGTKPLTRHPPGLYFLFFTEMWERFSYYGMRSLLVYYMTKRMLYPQEEASNIYGLYTGFVYFAPFFGGLLADRIVGQRRAVIIGALYMALGHFLMAFEPLFFPALVCLVIGNGFFKPNISTQVGALYPPGDPRRDRAFSIFYVGINLGAFFSPLVCGTLGETLGWHYGFGAAGVGMLAGLGIYLAGQKHLAPDLVMNRQKAETATEQKPLTKGEWGRIGALGTLCLFTIIFWGVYEQQGNTMALWADTHTDRSFFGLEMPASWYQAFNPVMIMILTPVVTGFWAWQARRGKEPSSATKLALGCIFLGLGQLIMIPAARIYVSTGRPVSIGWLTAATLVLTVGELYLSPVGLSLVTKLAPARMVSMLMGVWFLSSFFGNYLSGWLGMFWNHMSKEMFFLLLSGLAIAAGIGILALLRPLQRAMGTEAAGRVTG
jgi:POT family proton-dependent oligopeptide transporter